MAVKARDPGPRPESGALTQAADTLGQLMVYRQQGFVRNARQQRAGGLAALELAQKLRVLVSPAGRRGLRKHALKRQGA